MLRPNVSNIYEAGILQPVEHALTYLFMNYFTSE